MQLQLPLVPPGVPGEYRVILMPMGDDPAWTRPLGYMKAYCWPHATRWQCMVGRMFNGGQVGLVELCFIEEGQEHHGPRVLWSGRATDVPHE